MIYSMLWLSELHFLVQFVCPLAVNNFYANGICAWHAVSASVERFLTQRDITGDKFLPCS